MTNPDSLDGSSADELEAELEQELQGMVPQLLRRLEKLSERANYHEERLAKVRAAERKGRAALYALDPSLRPTTATGKSGPKPENMARIRQERFDAKVATVADYLREHAGGNGLADGFTATSLKAVPGFPERVPGEKSQHARIGTKALLEILPVLLDRGLVRADRRGQGGAVVYKVVAG
jgi:hypothetical protein